MQRASRILVVDDEREIRRILTEFLNRLGYEVEVACDGDEALLKLELDIDLILLDAIMPGRDGFSFLKDLRSQHRYAEIPVIMVTALTGTPERIRALEAGANDFLSKPIEFTELHARTASLLRMKHAIDDLKRNQSELEGIITRRTATLRKALDEVLVAERKLQQAQLETIHRLVIATEYRDANTASHIMRMSRYCELLAKKKRLDPAEVTLIFQASPMHDIGKISTPHEILTKPGKLDIEEWSIMKRHTLVGADILSNSHSRLLQAGESIALSHHERWDGTGYPNGLRGDDIPLIARICSVADVFDALTSERAYKHAFSNAESMGILIKNAGTHFDPELVELFQESKHEIMEIQQSIAQSSVDYNFIAPPPDETM